MYKDLKYLKDILLTVFALVVAFGVGFTWCDTNDKIVPYKSLAHSCTVCNTCGHIDTLGCVFCSAFGKIRQIEIIHSEIELDLDSLRVLIEADSMYQHE